MVNVDALIAEIDELLTSLTRTLQVDDAEFGIVQAYVPALAVVLATKVVQLVPLLVVSSSLTLVTPLLVHVIV